MLKTNIVYQVLFILYTHSPITSKSVVAIFTVYFVKYRKEHQVYSVIFIHKDNSENATCELSLACFM